MDITRKYFDSFQLKMIAACAMAIDHTAHLFFPAEIYMRCIGRLAFPIFAFLIAEGYRRTGDAARYMLRLFIFAVISQVPYQLMVGSPGSINPNVMFTLLFGLLAIYAIDKWNPAARILLPVLLAVTAQTMAFDHGAFGVLLVIAFYLTKDRMSLRNIAAAILILLFSTYYLAYGGINSTGWLIVLFYLAALPAISLYNNKKGISNPFTKWFFYIFYPSHIIILLIIRHFAG
ncbi:MAG: TraX family protein [Clostridia bacterium]